jgi:hypothetical protein
MMVLRKAVTVRERDEETAMTHDTLIEEINEAYRGLSAAAIELVSAEPTSRITRV